jgi:hypothetical protein
VPPPLTIPRSRRTGADRRRPRGRRGRIILGLIAAALVIALLGAGGLFYALAYRNTWLGLDGDIVTVFRGSTGTKALIAQATDVHRANVPFAFRWALDSGIPVDGVDDGLRLAHVLLGIDNQPDAPDGYDLGGVIIPAKACLQTTDSEATVPCSGPHGTQLLAAVQTPFRVYPGDSAMYAFADLNCKRRLAEFGAQMRGGSYSGGSANIVYDLCAARWRKSNWSDGAHPVGCFFAPGRAWKFLGGFPEGTLIFQPDPKTDVSTDQTHTFNVHEVTLPFQKANTYLAAYATPSVTSDMRFGIACRESFHGDAMYVVIAAQDGTYWVSKRADNEWQNDLATGRYPARTGASDVDLLCNTSTDGSSVELEGYLNGTHFHVTDTNKPLLTGNLALYMANDNSPPNGSVSFTNVGAQQTGGRAIFGI